MGNNTFIDGRQVYLRNAEEADVPLLYQWINDPEIRKFLSTRFPVPFFAESDYVKGLNRGQPFPTKINFIIVHKEGNVPIGTMGLGEIDWIDRVATTGTLIGKKEYHGKGYATDAKMHLLRYAFEGLGMHKIVSRAFADNVASLRYSDHCGYEREALLRSEKFSEGKWHDIVLLACFYDNWKVAWDKFQETHKG